MRKTTRLELAFVCYLLTFCISNVLVAGENSNPTNEFNSVATTFVNSLNSETLSNILYSENFLELSSLNFREDAGIFVDNLPTSNYFLNKLYFSEKPLKPFISRNVISANHKLAEELSEAGQINFEGTSLNTYMICYNSISSFTKNMILNNYTGVIQYWEKSSDGGLTWVNVGNAGLTSFNSYANVTSTAIFRAVISNSTLGIIKSDIAILNVIPDDISPRNVTLSTSIVCLGENVTVSSINTFNDNPNITEGDLNNSNPAGWVVNGDPKINFVGSANNTRPDRWQQTNDHPFDTPDGSITFDSKDKKFAIVSGRNYSILETPIFNTLRLTSATVTFDEAFIVGANTSMKIELSLDGGNTYTVTLRDEPYGVGADGIARSNNYSDFSGSNQIVDLSNYIGMPNLKIRFVFDAGNEAVDYKGIWALDAITIPQSPIAIGVIWTDEEGNTIGNSNNINLTPNKVGANSYDVASFFVLDSNGSECQPSSNNTTNVQIYAYDSYTSTASVANANCGNNAVSINAEIRGLNQGVIEVFPAGDSSIAEWIVISGPSGGTFTDSKDPNTVFNTTANGTYTLRWEIKKDPNSSCSATHTDITFAVSECTTIDFDGTDDHIDFGNNFMPSGSFSFEVWVKPNASFGNSKRTILSKSDLSELVTNGIQLYVENGYPIFENNSLKVISPYKIGTDRWYHLAVVSDGTLLSLYIDGIKVQTGSGLSLISNDYRFLVGASHTNASPLTPTDYFFGWMEELRIWDVALSEDQLHMMMNQKIKQSSGNVMGEIIPIAISNGLAWDNLIGYYQMEDISSGYTTSETNNSIKGKLINITTSQERTAPLPYVSTKSSSWYTDATWLRPNVWDPPNSTGINGDTINWNIAIISHNINSGGKDISLLGLLSQSNKLTMANPGQNLNENNSGQALTISHYLELNGNIDLVGESQLIQAQGSVLDTNSAGFIERDQQGTASSYNYNYWSSPVVAQGAANNSNYTIEGIMMDGTNAAAPKILNFGNGVTYADGAFSNPRKVSTYWLYKFRGEDDEYSDWEHIGSSGVLNAGEGYTMKGTSGNAEIATAQNYTFKGKPNNGDISLNVGVDKNYLVGNPYPSALDGKQFILDNINDSGGNNSVNVFNGALYFWDHFGGKTHTLREYIGGYATYNLLGGLPAIATDDRINSTGDIASKTPGRYIPVGQGFFVNTAVIDSTVTISGGDVLFKNKQRTFIREMDAISVFHGQEINVKSTNKEAEEPEKIRISFKSPLGYNRQLLVGADPNASNGFDLGYDAPMNEFNKEDMFWIIGSNEFVIQGVGNFDPDQVLPLGIVVDKEGEFSIQIDSVQNISDEKRIYLKDKLNNVIHDLRKSEYKSTSKAGYIVDRFEIVFYKEEDASQSSDTSEEDTEESENAEGANSANNSTTTEESENTDAIISIEDPKNETIEMSLRYAHLTKEIQILNPQQVVIKDLRLYSMEGGLIAVFGEIPNSKEYRLTVKNYSTGVYTVKCFLENIVISKNIIIKN